VRFIGSTNATEYLKDSTGNRRWWPVDCHEKKIDIEKLKGEVNQIWAEAYMLYVQGAKTYLSDAGEEIGKVFAPMLQKAAIFIRQLAERFQSLSPQAKNMVVTIGSIGVALIAIIPSKFSCPP